MNLTAPHLELPHHRLPDAGVFTSHSAARAIQPTSSRRSLDARSVRSQLPAPPSTNEAIRLSIITDLSGSMGTVGGGGNDPQGTRHEAALIALEHLSGHRLTISCRVMSFDRNSPLDLPWTRLDRRSIRTLQDALLAAPTGSSSCLGPTLQEAAKGTRAIAEGLIILSDFELYDHDVIKVLDNLITFPASAVTAVVFAPTPPAQLADTRVRVFNVDSSTTSPAEIARAVIDTAYDALSAAANGAVR